MQPDHYIIRKARGTDAEALQRLYTALVNDPQIKVDPDQIERMFHSRHSHLLVYESGETGEICGTVLLSLCKDAMYRSQPFAVVENIVVLHSERNKGIGSRLLKHVDSLCLELDCSKIMLSSSESRTGAHRFFTSHGYSGNTKRAFVKYRKEFSQQKTPHPLQPT